MFYCYQIIKLNVIKYFEKVYERVNERSGEVLDKSNDRDFNATSFFSTLYTTLPHNLIKDKLIDLIE